MHTLHYRLQDSNNEWSVPYAWQFFVIRRIVNTTIEATDIEYWVDTDSDNRSTMAVTNDSVAFTLDASTLREGMHTLYYRFKDNEGEYSVPHAWQFFVVRRVVNTTIEVTDIEYWVDTDYDNRSTMTVTDDSVAFTLDASTLREGMHTLYYRFRDNEGEHSYLHAWDFFVARYVNNDSINVTEVEYWVDTIRSNTQTKSVTDGAVAFTIDASAMRQGLHTLYYRFKDNEGGYSYLHTWQFFVVRLRQNETPSVIQCEYWLDDGHKQTMDITGANVVISISAVGMKSGTHTFYYRFRDNEGEYGQLYMHQFIKINPYDPIMILPYGITELDADMQTANPNYMAYPTILDEQMPDITCEEFIYEEFSVSESTKVIFSRGNLQYNAAVSSHLCADGSHAKGVFRFAPNQYDYIGSSNKNIAEDYDGWIDLFSWGTSGWNSGAVLYQPWSQSDEYYEYDKLFCPDSLTGAYEFADWGKYNAIGTSSPNTWRLLTSEEWYYLFKTRNNASELFGLGTINNTRGIILLPDNCILPSNLQFIPSVNNGLIWDEYRYFNKGEDHYSDNVYSIEEWEELERYGVVFLPAAGCRLGTSVSSTNQAGLYYSSSYGVSCGFPGFFVYFREYWVDPNTCTYWLERYDGLSVRLVKDKQQLKSSEL